MKIECGRWREQCEEESLWCWINREIDRLQLDILIDIDWIYKSLFGTLPMYVSSISELKHQCRIWKLKSVATRDAVLVFHHHAHTWSSPGIADMTLLETFVLQMNFTKCTCNLFELEVSKSVLQCHYITKLKHVASNNQQLHILRCWSSNSMIPNAKYQLNMTIIHRHCYI